MAYEFIVEDGSIVTGANSYVTVDYATTYIDQNIHVGPTWDALTELVQQQLLSWATRYIDQRAIWNGRPTTAPIWTGYSDYDASDINVIANWNDGNPITPTTPLPTTQPLRWPRAGCFDRDNIPVMSNVIPQQVQDATCEMARYLIAQDRSLERAQDGLKMLKADVVELIFKEEYYLPAVPAQIAYILTGLGQISSGNLNFGKIKRV